MKYKKVTNLAQLFIEDQMKSNENEIKLNEYEINYLCHSHQ